MPDWSTFKEGLHRVSGRVYAYIQPDGSWGLNNMGFVTGHGRSMMIDATTDVPRTKAAVNALAKAEPANARIDPVLLTHWHLDHAWGACMFPEGTRIISSKIAAKLLRDFPSRQLLKNILAHEGDAKAMMDYNIGNKFDFTDLTDVFATEEFEGKLAFNYDGIDVEVTELKPSHTTSDSVVFLKQEGVAHIGDIIAADRHWGLKWPGGANLIEACEFVVQLDCKTYIPGHGPILDLGDIKNFLAYVRDIFGRVRDSHARGVPAEEAYKRLLDNLGPYRELSGPARLYHTTKLLYCEFEGKLDEKHWKLGGSADLAETWHQKMKLVRNFPDLAKQERMPAF